MIFKKKEIDLKFADTTRMVYQYHPVVQSRLVPTHFQQQQINQTQHFKFANCPGMMDIKNSGYLITAWDDIHILANKAGVMVSLGGTRGNGFHQPKRMESALATGIFTPQDGIPLEVIHIGSPWAVMTNNKDISTFVIPAVYHSDFLDDLYVYGGIVDYKNFTSLNFIFSPKRACNITIKTGTPLLQVIPFAPGKITAGYGPANDYELDKSRSIFATAKQFYRKYVQLDKTSALKEI